MKVLDTPGLHSVSRSLTDRKLGSSNVVLNGSLEVFQCAKRLNVAPQPDTNISRPRAKTDGNAGDRDADKRAKKNSKAVGSPVPTFEQFAKKSSPEEEEENEAPGSSVFRMEVDQATTVKGPTPRLLQPPSDREAIGRARAFSLTSTATGLDSNVPMLEEVVLARSRSGTMDSVSGGSGVRSRSGSLIGRGSRSHSLTGGLTGTSDADKLRQDFIGILNETWGDHDFSSASPDEFRQEMSKSKVIQDVNVLLAELTAGDENFLMGMWNAVEDSISLSNEAVEVYKYLPDSGGGDPFSEHGNVWSFNYFMFNKDLKAICYFTCVATHNVESDTDATPSEVEESEPPSDYYVNSEDEDAED